MDFIYENENWPSFTWDAGALDALFSHAAFAHGHLLGKMSQLGMRQQQEAASLAIADEIFESSGIEGVALSITQIRSSVAKRFSLSVPEPQNFDRASDSAAQVMLDATQNFAISMSQKRLFDWHKTLFPTGFSGVDKIRVGAFRDGKLGPMRVVSLRGNDEQIHFEAPPAERVPAEMKTLVAWLNKAHGNVLRAAAIAHIWFLSIHPFDDGNGRLARVLNEWQFAHAEQSPLRFYSMSSAIQKRKKGYYKILEKTQRGGLDISEWLAWFLQTFIVAIENSENILKSVLAKNEFWKKHNSAIVDPAQRKMLNRLFDGFDGNLTSSKWAKICKCSQDTASRAIQDLLAKKILKKVGDGRSTHYVLCD